MTENKTYPATVAPTYNEYDDAQKPVDALAVAQATPVADTPKELTSEAVKPVAEASEMEEWVKTHTDH